MKMENVNEPREVCGMTKEEASTWAEKVLGGLVGDVRSCVRGMFGEMIGRGTEVNTRPRPDVRKVKGIKLD